jgi:pyruvate-formate lyase-activating enzyme
LGYSELRKIAGTLQELPFPTKFAVEVCSRCNLQCVHCHQPTMKRDQGVMPFDLWRKCADEVADRAPETECWFSFCGEPLLEPELLCRIFSYGKSVGLEHLNLNTNGMLLTPGLADSILDSGVDLVVFGVDGLSKRTYESIRLGGNRDLLFDNIKSFLKARFARNSGPEIQVQFVEMDENEDELEDFRRYWLDQGAIVKIRKKLSWGGRITTDLDVSDDDRIPCPWAITVMHVFWDGRVPRCSGDTEGEDCVGSAWDESLAELWNRLEPYRSLQLERRFQEAPERCRICKDWMTGAAVRARPSFCDGSLEE